MIYSRIFMTPFKHIIYVLLRIISISCTPVRVIALRSTIYYTPKNLNIARFGSISEAAILKRSSSIISPSFYSHALWFKSAGWTLFSDSQKSYELGNGLDCADNTDNDLNTC